MPTSRLQREARRRAFELRRALGQSIRRLREDASLTLSAVAAAAGIDRRFLARLETGDREGSIETYASVLAVLGADLSVRGYPTSGPTIHDRHQAAMVESFLKALHPRWTASPEVPVVRPARGVIDVVITERVVPLLVATEHHSELRRLEQQIRWHREKELSLPSSDLWRFVGPDPPPETSRLLVLRSTRALRDLAVTYEQTLRAAYPARTRDVVEALTTQGTAWPGAGIAWMWVEGGRATLMDRPPRGVRLGR